MYSRQSGAQLAIVEVGGAHSQRAIEGAVGIVSGIRMNSQSQINRHTESFLIGNIGRAARYPVGHKRAHIDVVLIVISPLVATIDAVRRASPLGIVASTLKRTHQTTRRTATGDISHTATETHSTGGDDAFMFRLGGDDNLIIVGGAATEVERSEIDPSAAAHALVYVKIGSHAFMIDTIEGIGDTLLLRSIRDIDGIVAGFRNVWPVSDEFVVALGRVGLADSTLAERIVAVVDNLVRNIGTLIVIDDDLVGLPVALTRRKDHSAGILEHRNEIRHYDGLGEEVLGSGIEQWSLPLPETLLVVIIVSVTLPDSKMLALQSGSGLLRTGDILHPRRTGIGVLAPPAVRIFLFFMLLVNTMVAYLGKRKSALILDGMLAARSKE